MKFSFACMECFRVDGQPSDELVPLELREDGLYELTCSKGHVTHTVLQENKFEVLFEIAANAILDGYYREAVSSFSAALERFYEFSLEVFCTKAGLKPSEWLTLWKTVSGQSERQLGAFVFLHAAIAGSKPEILTDSQRRFRNDVIHKGHIATRDEAITYGDVVRVLIDSGIATLRAKCGKETQQIIVAHMRAIASRRPNGTRVASMSAATTLSMASAANKKPLTERLEELRKRRAIGLVSL